MLTRHLHDFRLGEPRLFAAGGYPCCCDASGSSATSSGSSGEAPPGSPSPVLPGCQSCEQGLIARQYQIELTGIVPGIPGCDECPTLNGVYIVEITLVSETVCYGALPIDGACADDFENGCYRELQLHVGAVDAELGVPVWITIGPRSGESGPGDCNNVANMMWQAYLSPPGEPAPCLELAAHPIPFHSAAGLAAYCEGQDSIAYLTTL